MAITSKDFDDKLHRIRIRLYKNYLPNVKGMYMARTANEGSLSIEEICDQMVIRGGFDGDYKTLVENIKAYFTECAYNLADGWAINTGFYTVFPNIGGTFNSASEPYNAEKHRITFRFRANAKLRKLLKEIDVVVEGVSDARAYVYEFIDTHEGVVNDFYEPGNQFCIRGSKIKIEGDAPGCGLFFVPVDDPSAAVKVERLAVNTRSLLVGICPNTLNVRNRIEVRTQYTGSKSILLKEPRIITSDFVIEAM